VANGRFQIWWPLECSMLGGQWGSIFFDGQWKVLSLVVNEETSYLEANGRFQCLVALERFQIWWPLEEERKTSFSPPSTFHPIKFYFTMVLNHCFISCLPFPWPINYDHASRGTKFSTHSSPSQFWLKIFSLL